MSRIGSITSSVKNRKYNKNKYTNKITVKKTVAYLTYGSVLSDLFD